MDVQLRRLLGTGFGAGLASATVAAAASCVPLGREGGLVLGIAGAAIGAVFSSLIAAYALSWRSAVTAIAAGAGLGAAAPVDPAWAGVAACWAAAVVVVLAIQREAPDVLTRTTSPGLVGLIHALQLPLIAFSTAVSVGSVAPRPFVMLYTACAFTLWRRLGGDCPISRAEFELRGLRGEQAPLLRDAGFVGHHLHRATGLVLPRQAVPRLAYALAVLTFGWYAIDALR